MRQAGSSIKPYIYTAAIETTTETPAALADEINLIWIRGFIDLAAAA